jgi:redox-sensitive bicupin YhaK (pirin superfamily)
MTRARQLIHTHIKDVGGIPVRRALPGREVRRIGAWCFLDHIGPSTPPVDKPLNVGPHPHIGLQTFTWMISGEILHRDSLGFEQWIRPGQVNLMTAGRGIAHSEESPHGGGKLVHAVQLWIALPDAERHRAPDFTHYPELPRHKEQGLEATLLVGEAFGLKAPTQVYSPLLAVDLLVVENTRASLPLRADFEYGLICLEGEVEIEAPAGAQKVEPGQLLYLGLGDEALSLAAARGTRLLLVGGEPLREDILLWWNFVARTQAEIEQASLDWNAGRHFAEVTHSSLPRLQAPSIEGLKLGVRS